MTFNFKRFLISIIVISIIVPVIWYGYVGYWQLKTKRLYVKANSEYEVMYGYHTKINKIDQTLIGRSREDGRKLVHYYSKLNELKFVKRDTIVYNGDTLYKDPISVPVPINYVGVKTRIYVSSDEKFKEVVKGYVFNVECWGYFVAYIPSINIHETEPSEEQYIDFMKYVDQLPKSNSNRFGSLSPYGFYCN
ncbi:hypothetical protein KIH41_17755 [Litoribacter ruber]|uniref:Uncharacterized protein n=1 Tax=Litoribacter ruber TaxID=702568 RepID=A0AAP2CIE3_9BACT|nr:MULTISPECIES: hypothetical protein [Litoribacter]MBS9525318.1 hypothetical protein [Litoribacter alkaliphilus]MBT0813138.1 hypothetical protein [Litoribacter ruber]